MEKMWTSLENKQLAPQEKILMLKQEVDETVKNFTQKDPADIRIEELYEDISKIDSLQPQAEKLGDESLPQYLRDNIEKLRNHKHSTLNSGMKEFGEIKTAPKADRFAKSMRIGTHNK